MSKLILSLASLLTLATAIVAAPTWPAEVLVGTEPTAGKQFKPWVETDGAKYAGTYKGDIGGDTSGELTVKVAKPRAATLRSSFSGPSRRQLPGALLRPSSSTTSRIMARKAPA